MMAEAAAEQPMIRVALVVVLALVAGCRAVDPSGRAQVAAHAQAMAPADQRLAGLYTQSCKGCHTALDSGAPLAGDREAWAARLAKGLPALLQSTVTGLGGMPPGGQCFACAAADYEALIRFMADQAN